MTDTARATDIREAPLAPGGSVEILLASSDLRIRGVDGDRVVVRTRGGQPVDDDVRIDATAGRVRIRDAEGGLHLGPIHIRTRGSASLDIDVPRRAAIALRTMSGDVTADGIGGPSRWTTASGDLRVAVSAGPVVMETMSGDAVLEAAVPVEVTARTVSGDVRVRAPRLDVLDASTTSGDVHVEAELDAGGRHAITSVSGDVEITTPSPVRLEANTIAGDVRATGTHIAEGGRGRRTLVVGNGSVTLSVRTTSGDIRLRALAGGLTAPGDPAAASAPRGQGPAAAGAAGLTAQPVVVAEAEASPNLRREPADAGGTASGVDRREQERLELLRALERGDLDVETAAHRLEILDDAGPRAFRGWC